MATTFRNKVVKDIGTQKIIAITTNASTRSTIIGISLVNTTKGAVSISLLIGDDASSEGYYLKDVLLPPKGSLKPLGPAEKLILAPNNTLLLQSNKADSVDAVLSYVDIV
tara:strand:+ start:1325 stop:1654 length:330 start_codon:yes stop_codon:yes gene_type:complete